MPPGSLLNLSAPQSESFASPSVFRHFGSMKSKHPGGRVAVLCWCFTPHSRYVNKAKVLEGKQPNGSTPATGTCCNAARGRRHNDWIIEELSAAMWHCCVSQRCRCEITASIKLKHAAGRWGFRQSSPLWDVSSTQSERLVANAVEVAVLQSNKPILETLIIWSCKCLIC